jgi:hypothetical protein
MEKKKKGRKPLQDPKIRLDIWVETFIVDINGGKEIAKEKCKEFLKQAK